MSHREKCFSAEREPRFSSHLSSALIACSSMGGWTVLYYILKYPPTASTIELVAEAAIPDSKPPRSGKGYLDRERPLTEEKSRVQVAGAFVLCPMVEGESCQRRP